MFKGTIYLLMGQVVFVSANLILHGFLGRKLGPEDYGIFGIINALIVLYEVLFMRATTEGISKFVASDTGSVRSIIDKGIKLQMLIGLTIGFLFFYFSPLIAGLLRDPSISGYIKMLSVLIPITAFSFVYTGALNGMRAFGKQAKVWIGFSLTRLFLVILFVSLGLELNGVIFGLILSGVIQLWIAKKYCMLFKDRCNFNIGRLAGFVPQLILISFSTAIIMNIDIVAIKAILMSDRLTGIYTSAITIARVPFIFLAPLTLTLFPSVAKAVAEKDLMYIRKLINDSLRYLLIFIMPLVFIVMATSRELLSFIYGSLYTDASLSLKILIFGIMLHTVKVLMYNVIVASGRPRIVIIIGLFSVALDVTLILALISRFGIIGVALATTITNCFGFFLSIGYVRYRFKTLVKLPSLLRIVIASGATYSLALFTADYGLPLPLNYLALFLVYSVLLFIMKEINTRDIDSIKDFLIGQYLNLKVSKQSARS